VSYYADTASWALYTTWMFAADKLLWGIPVAAASAVIASIVAGIRENSWRPVLGAGLLGALGGPIIVLLAGFAFNLLRFPPIHEANFEALEKRVTELEQKPVAVPQLEQRLAALEQQQSVIVSKFPPEIESFPHISEAITAVIYSRRLNMRLESLKSMLENYKKYADSHLNLMVTSPEDKRTSIARFMAAEIEKRIKEMAKDDLGTEDINFEQHPRFDTNHHFKTAPQDILPQLEEDYIRYSEKYENGAKTIEKLRTQYQNAWSKYETIISDWK
jgi:hypothetical protein